MVFDINWYTAHVTNHTDMVCDSKSSGSAYLSELELDRC
jgi:hypothetical protein